MNGADTRIVQMQFDNEQFEKGIKESLNSLDKLKEKLDFDATSDGMNALKQGASKLSNSVIDNLNNMATRFNSLGTVAGKALDMIKTKFAELEVSALRFVKSMSVDQISAGLSKYEEKMTSVRTILAATAKEGKTLEDVDAVLSRLNEYTDQTSYGFTEMTNTIGKFTAAGVDLNTAEKAMEGIANWAAESGVSARNVTPAFYNLAQAIGAGSLKLQDWKSIENVNMATSSFKQTLIDAGVAMGTLKKDAKGLYKTVSGNGVKGNQAVDVASMGQSLTYGWATKDVLLKALETYYTENLEITAEDVDNLNKELSELQKQYDKTTNKTEQAALAQKIQAKQTEIQTAKAYMAAREAKSFTDVIDALKDAVSTGWMNSFEMIFGNVEEASVFFTDLADKLITISDIISSKRNEVLEGWNLIGGRESLLGGFDALWEGLSKIAGPLGKAFDDVLKPMDDLAHYNGKNKNFKYLEDAFGEQGAGKWVTVNGWSYYLKEVTDSVVKFAEDFNKWFDKVDENGTSNFEKIQTIATGVASAFGIVWKVGSKVSSTIKQIASHFSPIIDVVVDGFSRIAERVTAFNESFDVENSALGTFMDTIGSSFGSSIDTLASYLGTFFDNIIAIIDSDAVQKLSGIFDEVASIAATFVGTGLEGFTKAISVFNDLAAALFGLGNAEEKVDESKLGKLKQKASEADKDSGSDKQNTKKGKVAAEVIKDSKEGSVAALSLTTILESINTAMTGIKAGISSGIETIGSFFTNIISFAKESKILDVAGKAVTSFFKGTGTAINKFFTSKAPIVKRVGTLASDLWKTISNVFSPANVATVRKAVSKALSDVVSWITKTFSKKNMQSLWKSIKDIGTSVWNWISKIFSEKNVNSVLTDVGKTFEKLWSWIVDVFSSINLADVWKSIKDFGLKIWDWVKSVFSVKNINTVLSSIGNVFDKLWTWLKNAFSSINLADIWESIKNFGKTVWEWIKSTITNLDFSKIGATITDIGTSIVNFFRETFSSENIAKVKDAVVDFAKQIWASITSVFNGPNGEAPKTIGEGLSNLWNNLITGITNIFGEKKNTHKVKRAVDVGTDNVQNTIWDTVLGWFKDNPLIKSILEWAKNTVDSIWNSFTSLFNGANGEKPADIFEGIKNFGLRLWTTVSKWFNNSKIVKAVIKWVRSTARSIWNSFTALFNGTNGEKPADIFEGIKNFGTNVWNKVSTWFKNNKVLRSVLSWVNTTATNIFNGFKQLFNGPNGEKPSNIFEGIKNFGTNVWNYVQQAFGDAKSIVGATVNKIVEKAKALFESFKSLFNGPEGTPPESIIEGIKNFGVNVWAAVSTWADNDPTVQTVITWINEQATALFNSVKSLFNGPEGESPESVLEGITNFGRNIWESLTTWAENNETVQAVINWFNEKAAAIRNTITSFFNGGESGTEGETTTGKSDNIFTRFWAELNSIFDSSDESQSFLDKVEGIIKDLWTKLKGFLFGEFSTDASGSTSNGIDSATNTVDDTKRKLGLFDVAVEALHSVALVVQAAIEACQPAVDAVFGLMWNFVTIKLVNNVSKLLGGLGKKLNKDNGKGSTFAENVESIGKLLFAIAIAIGVVAAAVYFLGNMDPKKLNQGIGSVVGLLVIVGLLAGLLTLLTDIDIPNADGKTDAVSDRINALASMLKSMAIAVGAFAAVILVFGEYLAVEGNMDKALRGLGALVVIIVVLLGTIAALNLILSKGKESNPEAISNKMNALGQVLTAISIAIGVMAAAIIVLGLIPTSVLIQGGIALAGIVVALILMTLALTLLVNQLSKSSDASDSNAVNKKLSSLAKMLLVVVVAIGVMIAAIIILGNLPTDVLIQGGIALGAILVAMVLLTLALTGIQKLSKGASFKDLGGFIASIVGAVVMIGVLVGALLLLKDVDPELMATFAQTMLVMAIVAVAMAGAIRLLQGVDFKAGITAIGLIAVLLIVLGAVLSLISGTMQAMATGLTDFASGITLFANQMSNASAAWANVDVEALKTIPGLVYNFMVGLDRAKISDSSSKMNDLVRVASSLSQFATLTQDLTNLDGLQSFVIQLGVGVLAPLRVMASSDSFDSVITKLTELGGAIRLFFRNASTEEGETNLMMDENAMNVDTITTMFAKLNEIIDAIPDDAKADIQNGIESLPTEDNVASFSAQLSALGGAIIQFASDCESVKDADLTKATSVLNMVETIKEKLVGKKDTFLGWTISDTTDDLANFSTDLTTLGSAVGKFIESCKGANGDGVTDSDLETATNSIKILGELSKDLPSVGGLKSLFTGTQGLGNLAVGMTSLGAGVVQFLQALDPEKSGYTYNKERVDQAVDMVRVLGGVFKSLPTTGGMASWFSGNASFANLADGLGKLGTELNSFYMNIPNIDDPERLTGVMNSIVKLGEAGQYLNNAKQFKDRIKDLTSVTEIETSNGTKSKMSNIELFGLGLTNFYKSVAEISDTTHFDQVLDSTNKLVQIFTVLQGANNAHDRIKNIFGNNGYEGSPLSLLAEGLVAFNSSTNQIIDEGGNTLAALTNFKTLAEGLAALPKDVDISSDLTGRINDALGQIRDVDWSILSSDAIPAGAGDIVSSIAKVITTDSNGSSLTNAGKSMINAVASGMDISGFKITAKNLVLGFARGILTNSHYAEVAARELARRTKLAADNELEVGSPSKVFYRIGEFVDQGFANGIKGSSGEVFEVIRNMADGAIATADDILTNLSGVNFGGIFDSNSPTIRPVLDMTDIQTKSSLINGLLGNMTNVDDIMLGASVSGMKAANIGYGGRAPSSPNAADNSGIVESLNNLGDQFEQIAERMEHLEVVLDTGATVGALAPKMDRTLGRRMYYGMRGLAT